MNFVVIQTFIDIEHLAIDGDSKNNNLRIVTKHCNPKIRLISEPKKVSRRNE